MILEQYYLACLAHASYLIGDEGTKEAAVVDPQRDVDQYVAEAEKRGLRIRHVILTHFHADFVAGHLELARRTGATIHLGARAEAEYAFHPLADGDTIVMGKVKLAVLETPGHTPEGISILVFDLARDAEKPHAVLTGDTLFLGDIGRPDLMASVGVTADELAGMMYDSLRTKLMKLPDETLVYPAHGAGSSCGKKLSTERVGTIGQQKQLNWALQPMNRESFVRQATADLPAAPAYFPEAANLNKRERPVLEDTLAREVVGVSLDELLGAQKAGAIVLDARDPDDYARGHLAGTVNIGLSGKYAHWCGSLLDRTRPIVLVAPQGREREAALRLGRIGYDRVRGFLAGGFEAAKKARPDLVRTFGRQTAAKLAGELAAAKPPLVLDVRQPGERATSYIPGSLFVPLDELEKRAGEIPRDRRLVVQCAGGYRSSIAASLLLNAGFTRVEDLIGGIGAWEAEKHPVRSQDS